MHRLLLVVFLLLTWGLEGQNPPIAARAAEHTESAPSGDAVTENLRTANALVLALERKDLEATLVHLAANVTLVLPLAPDGNNDPGNVDRFEGREAVRTALQRNFAAYKRIAFVDEVITPSADGKTIFVEARGQFDTLHGRPYRNVYLIKLEFDDAGAVTGIEEWTNPVTASMTWGFPIGSSTVPRFTAVGLAIAVGVVSGGLVTVIHAVHAVGMRRQLTLQRLPIPLARQ